MGKPSFFFKNNQTTCRLSDQILATSVMVGKSGHILFYSKNSFFNPFSPNKHPYKHKVKKKPQFINLKKLQKQHENIKNQIS
jgi:hypothetical protein